MLAGCFGICQYGGVNGAQTVQTVQTVHNRTMKTETTRVMVPISPEVKAVFERLAASQGCTVGRAISEWLNDTIDGVQAITEMVEKAKKEPVAVMRQLHSYAIGLGEVTNDIMEDLRKKGGGKKAAGARHQAAASGSAATGGAFHDEDFQAVMRELESRGGGLTPPVSNTGGKLPRKPKK